MTYGGSVPPGQTYDGRQPQPNPQYALYGSAGQPSYPYPLDHMQQPGAGYIPAHQPFHPTQQMQYPLNNLPPVPLHNVGYNSHATFAPPPHYIQPSYPVVAPPPMPAYQASPIAHPMPPPQPQSHRPATAASTPSSGQNRRISSHGAIQKPGHGSQKSLTSTSVTKSPTVAPRKLVDPAVLICIADECLTKARSAAQPIASSPSADRVQEYHKLISTGLGCLDAALQTGKLSPRTEALVRLQYGSLLCEETENIMEAETCLNSAITLCEKHRLTDLKLYSQYLFMKVLFRRNPRAAHIALDAHIADFVTYKQAYWIYAFRFLKASFFLHTASSTDAHTTENLRSIAALATQRNDKAICVLAALLEGLVHLKAGRDDAVVRVQTCIAQASKYQLDTSCDIPQLVILTHLLDLACGLLQKVPELVTTRLKALQKCLDEFRESPAWNGSSSELLLPLRRHSTSSPTICSDTAAVIRPGDGEVDYLVLKSFSKAEAYALGHSITGLASLFRTGGHKPFESWSEGLKILAATAKTTSPTTASLQEALQQEKWRSDLTAYIYIMFGLHAATRTEWRKVNDCNRKLDQRQKQQPLEGSLGTLAAYLGGAFEQGVGRLDAAKRIFDDPRFALDTAGKSPRHEKSIEFGISLLAALNRVLIMQEKGHRDDRKIAELVEQLGRYCSDYDDVEIRAAFHLTMAITQMNPPLSINDLKQHLHVAIQTTRRTNNTHCLSMALNTMRYRLFEDNVGEQAVKSAKAGTAQAMKSGNLLWMSVAEFMCAKSYESRSQTREAEQCFKTGTQYANESWSRTQV